ncbi:hypothetical protein, partial [Burkholderia sp. Tr-862]|uniref:hypothetical protein n=1 Tax=Burkholderia sp. Tr-862 TaxID=2608331 RepID=UPI001B3A59B7
IPRGGTGGNDGGGRQPPARRAPGGPTQASPPLSHTLVGNALQRVEVAYTNFQFGRFHFRRRNTILPA